jgi:hypothetical protein
MLTPTMRRIIEVAGDMGEKLRHRRRSAGHRSIEIGRASRGRGPQVQKKAGAGLSQTVGLDRTSGGAGQTFLARDRPGSQWILGRVAASRPGKHERKIDTLLPRVNQVASQTRARIIHGVTIIRISQEWYMAPFANTCAARRGCEVPRLP